ncbi:MAG: high-affinity branched-chain amino acid ABC transporter permease LivM [Pseudomonadota bacterium]|nr:high-affinity branched-chain amino acid ABC transporter permease LivM [Pseudomonadota bacterium]
MAERLKDAFLTAMIAGLLALPLAGARTIDGAAGLSVEWHVLDVGVAAFLIFLGRLLLGLINDGRETFIAPLACGAGVAALYLPFPSHFLQTVTVAGAFGLAGRAVYVRLRRSKDETGAWSQSLRRLAGLRALGRIRKWATNLTLVSTLFLLFALVFPVTPLASRYALDVATMVLTYIMLAWGLNITVGYAGLLDLGYAGFYALGAYSYALLAQHFGLGFWTALPLAGLIAAGTAFGLGLPVLRLRGDYFAIVTLGFGEIVRLVLINWTKFTGGPNGISDVPRPTLFGLEFARDGSAGHQSFHDFLGIAFQPTQRVVFLYYLILVLALAVGWGSAKLRRLPIGRAWEAFREDEIACASIGINRWYVKLSAYSLGATVAGLAGAFFATRQGFISPESFTFTESATMLAIVILGGIGHPLGMVLAAFFVVGLPELFREFEQYRMLAFGAGMVLIMLWRPGGMMSERAPTIRLDDEKFQIP